MQQDISDTMVVDPDRGFIMAFFNAPEIKSLDVTSIQDYVSGSEYGTFNSPDGYNCQVLIDQDYLMILMRGVHSDGHVMIRSEFRPLELSIILKNVPDELRELINKALQGHLPNYSSLAEDWFASINDSELFEKSIKVIKMLPHLETSQSASFSAKDAFNVLQAEYGITKYDADRPVLASKGAGPCVILSVYNEQERKGFLSHIDDATDLDEVSASIFKIRSNFRQALTAHMNGGWGTTSTMIADIALRVEEHPNSKLLGWKKAEFMLSDLALDTRNGNVYETFNSDQVDKGPLLKERDHRIMSSFNGGLRPPLPVYHYTTGRDTVLKYTR